MESGLELIRRIFQLVLSESSFNLREEIYQNLTMGVLGDSKEPLTCEEIQDQIKKDLGTQTLPLKLVSQSINKMVEEKSVVEVELDGIRKYYLGSDLSQKMELIKGNYQKKKADANKTLLDFTRSHVKKKLSRKAKKRLVSDFESILGLFFSSLGIECANSILGTQGNISNVILATIEGQTDPLESGISLFPEIPKSKLTRNQKIIINCLREKNEELAPFLLAIAQSYYLIQVLNLDPTCQHYSMSLLKKKTLYLDTNCLMTLLINDPKQTPAIRELVNYSKQLEVNIVFTEITREEFIQKIARLKKDYSLFEPMPQGRYERIKEIFENNYLADFMKKRQNNPKLTWEGYFERLDHFDRLITGYAVMDDETIEEIFKTPEFEKLIEIIDQITAWKHPVVQQHDAYHILLTKRKREEGRKSDLLGPNFWFLTFDRSLKSVEKECFPDERVIQNSIEVDRWMALITPFIAPQIPGRKISATFAKLFASTLPRFGSMIKERDIIITQGQWMDTEGLEAEDIAETLGNKHVKSIISTVTQDPKTFFEKREYFNEQFTIIAKEIVSEKVKRQQMSITELKERIESLEKKDEEKHAIITTIYDRIDDDAIQFASTKIRNIKRLIMAGIFILLLPLNYIPFLLTLESGNLSYLIFNIFSVLLGTVTIIVGLYNDFGLINAIQWWENKEAEWYSEKRTQLLEKYHLKSH